MLNNDYQNFIAKSRYAKWLPSAGRRETWEESVDRSAEYQIRRFPDFESEIEECYESMKRLEVMGSMRHLMTAGEALSRDNVAAYNCSYLAVDSVISFDESMYILLCGTGVGFSCERQYVSQLPVIEAPDERMEVIREEIEDDERLSDVLRSMDNTHLRSLYRPDGFHNVDKRDLSYLGEDNVIHIADTKYGWASGLRILLVELWNANFDIKWDVSKIRPAGARLKTFGGRASGPEPLESLFTFCVEVFKKALGRRLQSVEVHDIMCKIAEVVVVGGVRRSALISLSNLTDDRMRRAKSGQWWVDNSQRALANNSVCYTEKPDMAAFMDEWRSLYESKSGERGIFSRTASEKQAAKNARRNQYADFGTNPCSEIILRSRQFCNLSEVVVRSDDTLSSLKRKVRAATILGTIQATLTDFVYLSSEWKKNTEEEALLGVSLTGIMDNRVLAGITDSVRWLEELKQVAIDTNKEWAEKLGINQAAAVTCVKPSGTVSQLVNSASGIHPRHSQYYIRTVRQDNKDPLTQFLKDQGVPSEPCQMKPESTTIFSFPVKAPDNCITVDDVSALKQLELWKIYQENWCEHKPSITVYVAEDEWMSVGAWVYEHFDILSGVSFLPKSDHTYAQAPYQEIDEGTYKELEAAMPAIDWGALSEYEHTDMTEGSQQLACVGGVCEL